MSRYKKQINYTVVILLPVSNSYIGAVTYSLFNFQLL